MVLARQRVRTSSNLWVALVLLGIMLFLFLFILLFPRRKGTFELKEEQGKLVLHRKAIEGFVRSSLQDSDFLEAPTIRVKATKRRIKVNVKGTLKRTADLIGQTEAWSKQWKNGLLVWWELVTRLRLMFILKIFNQ